MTLKRQDRLDVQLSARVNKAINIFRTLYKKVQGFFMEMEICRIQKMTHPISYLPRLRGAQKPAYVIQISAQPHHYSRVYGRSGLLPGKRHILQERNGNYPGPHQPGRQYLFFIPRSQNERRNATGGNSLVALNNTQYSHDLFFQFLPGNLLFEKFTISRFIVDEQSGGYRA